MTTGPDNWGTYETPLSELMIRTDEERYVVAMYYRIGEKMRRILGVAPGGDDRSSLIDEMAVSLRAELDRWMAMESAEEKASFFMALMVGGATLAGMIGETGEKWDPNVINGGIRRALLEGR